MRVWIDVWDPTYSEQIETGGPIFLKGADISRGLDDTGDGTVDLMGIDPRAISYIEPRRVLELWTHETGFSKRLIGSFHVEGEVRSDSGEDSVSVKGRSPMISLIDKITLPGLRYRNETVKDVVDSLVALCGWTANVDASLSTEYISVPFNGDSVMDALRVIAETKGVHLRQSATVAKQIDFGAMGTFNGVHVEYVEGDGGEIHRRSTSPMLMEAISITRTSSDIFNWGLGFAGGSGDAAIDLGYSSRSFIDSISLYGRNHYFYKDNASIADYGQVERRMDAKRFVPVGTTDADIQYAADAAADAIKAKLDRHAYPQEVLSLTLRNVRQAVNVGDKIHITYQEMKVKNGIPYKWRDIDDDFWVMRASESITEKGIVLKLEVSNIDRYAADAAGVIVGMVDSIKVQEVDVQPYPVIFPWGPFQQPIDALTPVEFQFPIFNNVLRLNSVKMYLIRDVWTAVAGTAKAGGDHRHVMFDGLISSPDRAINRIAACRDTNGVAITVGLYYNSSSTETVLETQESSGTHGHDTEFKEVQKDTQKPVGAMVTVNATLAATGLFPLSTGDDIEEIDITDEVLGKAGGFRGWHDVTININSGRGDISAVFLIDVDISKVRV